MIPQAFTDLQAAAFQCLPSEPGTTETPALLADRRAMLAQALCAADMAGCEGWPAPALVLVEHARCALKAAAPVIDRATFRNAAKTRWPAGEAFPPTQRHPWQERADLA